MLVRDRYPAGVPCWIDLLTPDADAATDFYGGLFGWSWEERLPAEQPGSYRIASLDGLVVAAVGTPAEPGQPGAGWTPPDLRWNTYVAVDDADATANAVRDAGGAALHLFQPGLRSGVQLVNAPGTWNWSNLSTPDPDGAAAFYGAVFGWVARPVDLGGTSATMLTLPGYGDFLASLEPALRERQSGEGAPEGFADAVAWVEPAEPAATPGWSITFAVADTEATAARAVELGGTVLVPPFRAGGAHVATLTDPFGAALTVNTWER